MTPLEEAGGRRLSKAPEPPLEPDIPASLSRTPEDSHLIDAELEALSLEDLDWSGRDARGSRLSECELRSVTLDELRFERARLRDVAVFDSSFANAAGNEASLSRVRFERVRLTGAILAASRLDNVTFADCRLDMCSLRFSRMHAVRFEGCRMEGADLYEAHLESVLFVDCDLSGVTLSNATFARSEMRGCDLSGVQDPERLRGVRMPLVDVIRIAGELASGLGIEVLDD
jgi:uncharacterized protein YjbI with pentapeptide repeats